MGWWNAKANGDSLQDEPTGLVWGDTPADAIDRALRGGADDKSELGERFDHELAVVREEFRRDFGRLPTKEEVVAGLLFSLPQVRDFIRSLPDGPAPAPAQTAPGMLNVGPVSDEEWDYLGTLVRGGDTEPSPEPEGEGKC